MKWIIGWLFRLILYKYTFFFIKKSVDGYEAYYINRICVDDGLNEIIFEYTER